MIKGETLSNSRVASAGGAERTYVAYAGLFLGMALGIGVWLRAIFVWPWLKGPFTFQYLLHAHSHGAFFGWVTPALFGVIAAAAGGRVSGREGDGSPSSRLGWHAHALGLLSGAAMLAFALTGYGPVSIAISAGHVVLWYVFAFTVRRSLGHGAEDGLVERRFYRTALVLLLTAGTATVLPGVLMARGITEGWLRELGVELFLTPFICGWLTLGVMGAAYGRIGGGRLSAWALRLTAAGAIPSAILFVGSAPPSPALLWLGRAGSVVMGLGGLAFAADLLAAGRRAGALLALAGVAAAVKGTLELVAGLGAGAALLHSRPIVLAYLHLTLLGFITPALLATAYWLRAWGEGDVRPAARAWAPPEVAGALANGFGLAVMCGALLGLGWSALGALLTSFGITFNALFALAFAGGALCALAVLALLIARGPRRDIMAAADAPRPAFTEVS